MRSLDASKVEKLLATVTGFGEVDDPRPFPPELVRRVGVLVGADWGAYNELDRTVQRSVLSAWWRPGEDGVAADDPVDPT